jgi:hypothetical protein
MESVTISAIILDVISMKEIVKSVLVDALLDGLEIKYAIRLVIMKIASMILEIA